MDTTKTNTATYRIYSRLQGRYMLDTVEALSPDHALNLYAQRYGFKNYRDAMPIIGGGYRAIPEGN